VTLGRREWLRLGVAGAVALVAARRARAEERIRVRLGDGGKIEDLRLEDYVAGVVAGEMPASFPPEAQRAQAVAARSYALTRKIAAGGGKPWDIGAGVLAQVYAGRHSAPARAAADATAGEVLVLGMEPVEAYFHAVCGGRTEAGLAALGRDLPYLVSVECGFCDDAPGARWRKEFPAAELGRVAGLGGAVWSVRVASRTPSGRAEQVEISRREKARTLAAPDLRQRLGYGRLPSVAFEVSLDRLGMGGEDGFVFVGRGQGHGAGLCQHGAAGLARAGKGYREILARYYPGTDVTRMY
jgi:stage II sporulation protein D